MINVTKGTYIGLDEKIHNMYTIESDKFEVIENYILVDVDKNDFPFTINFNLGDDELALSAIVEIRDMVNRAIDIKKYGYDRNA